MKSFSWSLISSYALLAAASPLSKFQVNGRDGLSGADFDTFKYYAQHSGAAYCNSVAAVGSVITCSNDVCNDVHANGATILATYKGDATDLEGYVAQDPVKKVIVVSMRGSSNLNNFITDFAFFQQDSDLVYGGQVHIGFMTAWNEVSGSVLDALSSATQQHPDYKIVFTGHSLGAAVSSIGAAYARNAGYAVDMINFGSPRFGNDILVEYVTNQPGNEWRMTHLDDPVPRLPPILFNYQHTSPEYWLSDGSDDTDDYSVSDVVECDGFANVGCNAGTFGLNIISHLNYLVPIASCNSLEFILSKRNLELAEPMSKRNDDYLWYLATAPANQVSTGELEDTVNEWAQQDINNN